MMDLSVNIPLEEALDKGWEMLAACFTQEETGLRTGLLEKFWPKKEQDSENKKEELVTSTGE